MYQNTIASSGGAQIWSATAPSGVRCVFVFLAGRLAPWSKWQLAKQVGCWYYGAVLQFYVHIMLGLM